MGQPVPTAEDPEEGIREVVCERCGVTGFLDLTFTNQVSQCRCGSPVLGESNYRYEGLCLVQGRLGDPEEDIDEEPEYGPLDHPHRVPSCDLCAARRQRPTRHRLWCAVFFRRECNCGSEQA